MPLTSQLQLVQTCIIFVTFTTNVSECFAGQESWHKVKLQPCEYFDVCKFKCSPHLPSVCLIYPPLAVSKRIRDGVFCGLVQINSRAENARNFSQCDSLLMGNDCGAHTFPYIEVKNKSAQIEHEATTSKIGEDQLFYCNQRGIDTDKAIALIVNGFSKEVLNKLPMEFAVEAQKLLEISLEGSVG